MIFKYFPEKLQYVQNWLTLLMLAALTACGGAGSSGARDANKTDPQGKVSIFTKITSVSSAGLCTDNLAIYIDGEYRGTITYNPYTYPPHLVCGDFTQSGILTLNLPVGDHLIYTDGGTASCVSGTSTLTISETSCLTFEYTL